MSFLIIVLIFAIVGVCIDIYKNNTNAAQKKLQAETDLEADRKMHNIISKPDENKITDLECEEGSETDGIENGAFEVVFDRTEQSKIAFFDEFATSYLRRSEDIKPKTDRVIMRISLVLIENNAIANSYSIDVKENSEDNSCISSVIIGRGSDCDVQIVRAGISRRHCRLMLHNNNGKYEWMLSDLGSTNGTYLNNKLLLKDELVPVRNRERFFIGKNDISIMLFIEN